MKKIICTLLLTCVSLGFAKVIVPVTSLTDGKPHGMIIFTNTRYGLLIIPALKQLPPGMHGIHLHQNPSCENQGLAAGGHYDPNNTGIHLGPYDEGHLGDLPALYVAANGQANQTTLAPRLREKDIKGRAVIIHQGGDNYYDQPQKLGGGGARIACGVIQGSR